MTETYLEQLKQKVRQRAADMKLNSSISDSLVLAVLLEEQDIQKIIEALNIDSNFLSEECTEKAQSYDDILKRPIDQKIENKKFSCWMTELFEKLSEDHQNQDIGPIEVFERITEHKAIVYMLPKAIDSSIQKIYAFTTAQSTLIRKVYLELEISSKQENTKDPLTSFAQNTQALYAARGYYTSYKQKEETSYQQDYYRVIEEGYRAIEKDKQRLSKYADENTIKALEKAIKNELAFPSFQAGYLKGKLEKAIGLPFNPNKFSKPDGP